MNEFCDPKDYIPTQGSPYFLVTKVWLGKRYLIDFYEVRTDKDGKYFLSSKDWASMSGVKNYIVEIPNNIDAPSCIDISMRSPKWVDIEVENEYFVQINPGVGCYNRGIYVSDLAKLFRQGKLLYDEKN